MRVVGVLNSPWPVTGGTRACPAIRTSNPATLGPEKRRTSAISSVVLITVPVRRLRSKLSSASNQKKRG